MIGRVVAVGGPPGSGKSTAGRLVAAALQLEFVSAGEQFRAEAADRGLSLEGLSELAERDPTIDRALDERLLAGAAPGRLLDARLAGALLRARAAPVHYLWVTAEEAVRLARLAARDHVDPALCRSLTRAREASERRRYLAYYGIDLAAERPDLTVDSSRRSAEEVAAELVAFVRSREGSP